MIRREYRDGTPVTVVWQLKIGSNEIPELSMDGQISRTYRGYGFRMNACRGGKQRVIVFVVNWDNPVMRWKGQPRSKQEACSRWSKSSMG